MVIKANLDELSIQSDKLKGNIEELGQQIEMLLSEVHNGPLSVMVTTDTDVFVNKTEELTRSIQKLAEIEEQYTLALEDARQQFAEAQVNAIATIKFANKKWFGRL